MVTVTFAQDEDGRLSSLLAEGHTGWADADEDVVCAAVSAILQAAWLGLMEHAHIDVTSDRTKGRLSLRWPVDARDREDVRAIVGTAQLAVDQIARQYPTHVRTARAEET
jgi:uncharacterized protein